jgi:hypothetical protein
MSRVVVVVARRHRRKMGEINKKLGEKFEISDAELVSTVDACSQLMAEGADLDIGGASTQVGGGVSSVGGWGGWGGGGGGRGEPCREGRGVCQVWGVLRVGPGMEGQGAQDCLMIN